MSSSALEYICDDKRHLICLPYNRSNLHDMAADLGIKTCWYHPKPNFPHYDIPKKRIQEIISKCRVVTSRELLQIIKDENQRRQIHNLRVSEMRRTEKNDNGFLKTQAEYNGYFDTRD